MNKALRIIFAGTPEFAVPGLQALLASSHQVCAVYTQPDRPAGRGRQLTASPVKQIALQHQLPIYQPLSLRQAEAQAELANLNADVMIVIAYGLMLPPTVLTTPRYGCINVHASLLPRWRGAAPIQRAILAGDEQTGVTIMQMEAGLDTGPMLLKRNCPITATTTTASLHDQLAALGATALMTTLDDLVQGKLKPEAQDDQQACYASKLTKAEAQIDWHQSATAIARQIRAFNPWPVAYSQLANQTIRIWQAEVLATTTHASPGTLLTAHKQGIEVATGDGILSLTQLQLPGGRVLTAADLINAHKALWQGQFNI